MARARFLVVKTGSTVAANRHRGDFEDWIAAGLQSSVSVVRADDGPLPASARSYAGVVITGSPASVTEHAPWMIATGQWMREAVEDGVPLLGICFGHQLLAEALGGRVVRNPRGREVGVQSIQLLADANDDLLFCDLASEPVVLAQTSHVDTVERLPPGAVRLARSELDACHAFRVRADRLAWGVQFHPEFDADITRGYIRERAETMRAEGLDPERCLATCVDTPRAASLLARFADLAGGW